VIGLSVALHFHLLIFYYLGLVTFIFYFKLLDIILVSVRNVVPTLTSNKRQGISLNGRCQAIRDRVLSWFRPGGAYVQQWCARGTILLSTGVPAVGLLQARWERKRGLQVPGEVAEDIVGELESECMVCLVLSVVVPCRSPPSPAAGDFTFLL
jgi:hypothetical protein